MEFSVNSPVLFLLAGIIVAVVLAQSVYFLVKAWRRGREIGMPMDKLKKVVIGTAIFTVAPATAIVISVISLSKKLGIPLPWIAVEAGWFVAEYGRQPWAIGEVLPTAVANSSLTAGDLIFSMVLICGLYTLFLVAELFLMFKFARLGPSSLKTGRYHFEQSSTTTQPAR